MKAATNELCWWIELNGATHTAPNERLVPTRALLAAGKVYPDSRAGVIITINNAPARAELVSRQLLDVLHARFPGTRWWVKDNAPTPQTSDTPKTGAAS